MVAGLQVTRNLLLVLSSLGVASFKSFILEGLSGSRFHNPHTEVTTTIIISFFCILDDLLLDMPLIYFDVDLAQLTDAYINLATLRKNGLTAGTTWKDYLCLDQLTNDI